MKWCSDGALTYQSYEAKKVHEKTQSMKIYFSFPVKLVQVYCFNMVLS